MAPRMAFHDSTLPHWVVRDTMTSATTIPRFAGWRHSRFSTISTTFYQHIFSRFVGRSLHLVNFYHDLLLNISQTRNPSARLLAAGDSTSKVRLVVNQSLLYSIPRPRNEQTGEPVQRCAQFATIEWCVSSAQNATNLRVDNWQNLTAEALGLIDRPFGLAAATCGISKNKRSWVPWAWDDRICGVSLFSRYRLLSLLFRDYCISSGRGRFKLPNVKAGLQNRMGRDS
jgi:hypothetical protein